MELENIKQGEIEHVEKYYEHIEKLVHGLQTQFFGHYVLNKFIVLFEDYNYKNETYHIIDA